LPTPPLWGKGRGKGREATFPFGVRRRVELGITK